MEKCEMFDVCDLDRQIIQFTTSTAVVGIPIQSSQSYGSSLSVAIRMMSLSIKYVPKGLSC